MESSKFMPTNVAGGSRGVVVIRIVSILGTFRKLANVWDGIVGIKIRARDFMFGNADEFFGEPDFAKVHDAELGKVSTVFGAEVQRATEGVCYVCAARATGDPAGVSYDRLCPSDEIFAVVNGIPEVIWRVELD